MGAHVKFASDAADLFRGRGGLLVVDGHVGAGRRQRRGPADAAGGAGDQRLFPL